MFEALISFLGGSVFRMVWGEIASWYSKKMDHEHEMAHLTMCFAGSCAVRKEGKY